MYIYIYIIYICIPPTKATLEKFKHVATPSPRLCRAPSRSTVDSARNQRLNARAM